MNWIGEIDNAVNLAVRFTRISYDVQAEADRSIARITCQTETKNKQE